MQLEGEAQKSLLSNHVVTLILVMSYVFEAVLSKMMAYKKSLVVLRFGELCTFKLLNQEKAFYCDLFAMCLCMLRCCV